MYDLSGLYDGEALAYTALFINSLLRSISVNRDLVVRETIYCLSMLIGLY